MSEERVSGVGWFLYDADEKKVCLHRRDSGAPNYPSSWDYFGGGTDPEDQTELDTLRREFEEELGIALVDENVREVSRNREHVMYRISFSMKGSGDIRLGEGAGYAWITVEEAMKLTDITGDALSKLKFLAQESS